MLKTLVRFIKESEGASMFEYAILLGVGVASPFLRLPELTAIGQTKTP